MSDDDWDDDDDDWGDDNNEGNADDWGNEQMEDEDNFPVQKLSELEQLYEDADSDMSLRNKDSALEKFEEFIEKSKSEEKGKVKQELVVKALSSIVQLCTELEKQEKGLQHYKHLLEHLDSGSASQNEKKSAMSDVLSTFDPGVNSLAEQYYVLTIESLRNDDKLRFDFSMELARSYLEVRAWGKLQPLIEKMHVACKANGTDDPKKSRSADPNIRCSD